MTFLRNVLHDLVEKRLWPVAVALIVALVAVPVVLGGSEEPVAPVDDVAAVTPEKVPPGSAEVVSLDQNVPTGKVARTGKVRNPFKQQHLPKTDTAGAASSLLAATRSLLGNSSSPSSPSTGGSSPSGGGGGIQTPTPSPTPTAPKPDKPDPKDLYRVTLRFGEVGDLKTHKNVARLTPLPSSSNPFVVFLGIKADGKTAVFLVSSSSGTTGEGDCEPDDTCTFLYMKEDQQQSFEAVDANDQVVTYALKLLKINVEETDAPQSSSSSSSRAARRAARRAERARRAQAREGFSARVQAIGF
jgi:hypothetical protein